MTLADAARRVVAAPPVMGPVEWWAAGALFDIDPAVHGLRGVVVQPHPLTRETLEDAIRMWRGRTFDP